MSAVDSTGRFCPQCQDITPRGHRNKCKVCAARRQARYRATNSDAVRAGINAWRAANKSRANELSLRWAKENPERIRIHKTNRRKRAAGGKLSVGLAQKLYRLQRGRCACCGKPLGKVFDLDHIMPLARGGPNVDSNIQLLRPLCNRRKQARHPVDYMQSLGHLL